MSNTLNKPLCFVLMPFGVKKDPGSGFDIDFDEIYELGIRPGIERAGMEPIRADEERTGGVIHKPMFERLILCDFAVADLTTANANVFYELGVRHAVRPATTLTIFASNQKIPFDLNYLRSLPYALGENGQLGEERAYELASDICKRMLELKALQTRGEAQDSPIFQLLQDYKQPDISRLKTDVFRAQAEYSAAQKSALARARKCGAEAVREVERGLGGDYLAVEAGVLVDLFLSYRAVQAWQAMVDLFERLPPTLKRTVMMREQLGFALNRLGQRSEALAVLEDVVREYGRSSETCGLIGRIYKDQWAEAKSKGSHFLAAGYLDKAINAYREGFEADTRDAYPGINAVTLLEIKGDAPALAVQAELLPVVRFAVRRRLKTTKPDYWDLATQLELAVLAKADGEAFGYLGDALASMREPWEPLTTANNLKLIRDARRERGVEHAWLEEIIRHLEQAGGV
jgi:tetratricopeptide (TPR) repeat protein